MANCVGRKKFPDRWRLSFRNSTRAPVVSSPNASLEAISKEREMRKNEIERLLENAVAKALGLPMPNKSTRRTVLARKRSTSRNQAVRHAA